MNKLISLVLVLVLVFAFSVPSFAVGDNSTELDALNNIDYYVYWIFQDFTDKLDDSVEWLTSIWQILTNSIAFNVHNMADDLSSMYDNLFGDSTYIEPLAVTISNSLTGLEDSFNFFNDSFFDNVLWGEPFAEVVQENLTAMAADLDATYQLQQYLLSDRWDFFEGSWWVSMYEDIHQLKEVLASDEDLALRESVSGDVSVFSDMFFNRNSNFFVGLDSEAIFNIGLFSTFFREYFAINSGDSTTENISDGLEILLIYSALPFSWYSEETLSDLNSVPSAYSLNRSADTPQLATSYYQDTIDRITSLRSDLFG